MILRELGPSVPLDAPIVGLDGGHVGQMLELVELTQPGPFRPRTVEMGNYYGVFEDDRLVAMAGERLQTPHFTEVSAVCTHPAARGRGLATALTRHVATGIIERGRTPILHVAEQNESARRVYERLGFVVRARPEFVAARTPGPDDGGGT
jgi:predicted GNAT family acetyltransferase